MKAAGAILFVMLVAITALAEEREPCAALDHAQCKLSSRCIIDYTGRNK